VAEVQPRALEARADRDEDLVSEAEVLAKYGLDDKAMDRLREALEIKPTNVAAYALMIQMSLDQGKRARVAELANQLAAVAAEIGDSEVWPGVRDRLEAAGFWVQGEQVALAPPAEPEPEAVPRPSARAPRPEPAPAVPEPRRAEVTPGARRAKSAELDRMLEGLLAEPRAKRKPAPAPPQPPPPPSPAAPAPVASPAPG
jgi:hypothetical protein